MSTLHDEHVDIHVDDSHEETSSSNPIVRVAIIIGIVFILLLIAFSIVKVVPRIISSIGSANVSFSSLFSPKNKISVSTNASKIKSGEALIVNWKNNTSDAEGVILWSYKCVDGVSVEYNSISGMRPVLCDTNFPLPSDKTSYTFIVKTTNKTPSTIPMTVSLWDSELKNMKYSGSTEVSVLPEGYSEVNAATGYNPDYTNTATVEPEATAATSTTATSGSSVKNTDTKTTNVSTQSTGVADLKISLVAVGRVGVNGTFEQTSTFYDNDRVTVRFNVSNIGSSRTGAWTLKAILPTRIASDRIFTSKNQPSLNPGDSYELTISFDAYDPNGGAIQIAINSNDKNQANNTLSIPMSSNGSGNTSGGTTYNNTNSVSDLAITILDVGVMDRGNSQFYYSNSLNKGDKVAVRFQVQNLGNVSTGNWSFNAYLPSSSNSTFNSGMQDSLAPGQTKVFTVGFDNPLPGTNNVSFQINYTGNGYDTNNSNNFASRSINVNY